MPGSNPSVVLVSDFLVSGTVRRIFLLFRSHQARDMVLFVCCLFFYLIMRRQKSALETVGEVLALQAQGPKFDNPSPAPAGAFVIPA